MKNLFFCSLLCLALSGCQTIGGWFDSVGDHMPVIGERCEHWQCFTSSGQQISEQNKQQMQPQTQTREAPPENPPAGAQASLPPAPGIVPLTPPANTAPQAPEYPSE